MKNPTITICVPTYNRADLLDLTLKSIAEQTTRPYEVIVVDNASTDATIDIVKPYVKKGFRYVRNKTNVGMAENFNQAIGYARGTHVAFLHSDDLIAPTWHEEFSKAIQQVNADVYTSSLCTIASKGKLGFIYRTFKTDKYIPSKDALKMFTRNLCPILAPIGTTVYARYILKKYEGFRVEDGTEYDVLFSMFVLSHYSVFYKDAILFAYRSHPEQTFEFTQQTKSTARRLAKIDHHFQILRKYIETHKLPMNKVELIAHNVWMSLCSNNLYIIYGDVERVFGGFVVAFKNFPLLAYSPVSWLIFLNIQAMFIGRALFQFLNRKKYSSEVAWLKIYQK